MLSQSISPVVPNTTDRTPNHMWIALDRAALALDRYTTLPSRGCVGLKMSVMGWPVQNRHCFTMASSCRAEEEVKSLINELKECRYQKQTPSSCKWFIEPFKWCQNSVWRFKMMSSWWSADPELSVCSCSPVDCWWAGSCETPSRPPPAHTLESSWSQRSGSNCGAPLLMGWCHWVESLGWLCCCLNTEARGEELEKHKGCLCSSRRSDQAHTVVLYSTQSSYDCIQVRVIVCRFLWGRRRQYCCTNTNNNLYWECSAVGDENILTYHLEQEGEQSYTGHVMFGLCQRPVRLLDVDDVQLEAGNTTTSLKVRWISFWPLC